MVFPPGILTTLSFGAPFVSSWLSGRNQQQAAAQSNKEQKKINNARYEREVQLSELDYLSSVLNYAQQLSIAEANRYVDDVKRVDYEANQTRIIDTALKNLDLNIEAINDKFVTGEQLRYDEASLTYDDAAGVSKNLYRGEQTALSLEGARSSLNKRETLTTSASEAMLSIDRAKSLRNIQIENNNREKQRVLDNAAATYLTGTTNVNNNFTARKQTAKNLKNQQVNVNKLEGFIATTENELDYASRSAQNVNSAKLNNIENLQRVAQYMNSIKSRNLQGKQAIAASEAEGQNIQESIVIQDGLDTLKRDAESITAILDSATARNSATVRSGGSNSAEAVAMNKMKEFGRSYGELQLREKERQTKINGYNAKLKGETAVQMEQIARQVYAEQEAMGYTIRAGYTRQKGFEVQEKILKAGRDSKAQGIVDMTALKELGIKTTYQDTLNQLKTNRDSDLATLLTQRDNKIGEATDVTTNKNALARFNANTNIDEARLTKKNKSRTVRNENRLTQLGIKQRKSNSLDKYNLAMNTLTTRFNDILVPGFELGNREGNRTLQGQILSTQNTILANSTPFRPAIIEDPLPPIRGLAPEKVKSSSAFVPSTSSIAFDAFTAGFGGALNSSYTDSSGNLRFY